MNSARPIDAWQVLSAIEAVLRPILERSNGDLSLAADPAETAELLAVGPKAFRVVLAVDDEESLTAPDGLDGPVRTTIAVFVQRHQGLGVRRGKEAAMPGAPASLLKLADDVAGLIRSIRFKGEELEAPRFRSGGWLQADPGSPLALIRTRRLSFSVRRMLEPQIHNPQLLAELPPP